jgi:hypothetical protein
MSFPTSTHKPCPDCASSDACTFSDDGHYHCFSCGAQGEATPTPASDSAPAQPARPASVKDLLTGGEAISIPARKLTAATCTLWGYEAGIFKVSIRTPSRSSE